VTFITYSLAYVDRANYGIGSAEGLGKDLGITGEQDALCRVVSQFELRVSTR
jgi:hypothetical protein